MNETGYPANRGRKAANAFTPALNKVSGSKAPMKGLMFKPSPKNVAKPLPTYKGSMSVMKKK